MGASGSCNSVSFYGKLYLYGLVEALWGQVEAL